MEPRPPDLLPHDGGAHDLAVQEDRDTLVDVRAGHPLELAPAASIELEEDLRLVELGIARGGGVLELVAGQEGVVLEHPELPIEAAPH